MKEITTGFELHIPCYHSFWKNYYTIKLFGKKPKINVNDDYETCTNKATFSMHVRS
jgi:hypothetical protein